MKQTKWIFLNSIDGVNLEIFLNQQVTQGWKISKFTNSRIVFEQDESFHRRYHVTEHLYLTTYPDSDELNQQKKFEQFLDDYDVKQVFRNSLFEVYESNMDIDLFTDEHQINQRNKTIGKNGLMMSVIQFLVLCFTFIVYLTINNDGSLLLFPYPLIIAFVSFVLMIVSFFQAIRSWNFMKGQTTWDSYKFKTRQTDCITIIGFLFLISVVIASILHLLFVNASLLLFYLALIIGIVYRRFMYKKEIDKPKKIYWLVGIIVIVWMFYTNLPVEFQSQGLLDNLGIQTRTLLDLDVYKSKLEEQSCIVRKGEYSFSFEVADYTCIDSHTSILVHKNDWMKTEAKEYFVKKTNVENSYVSQLGEYKTGDSYFINTEKYMIYSSTEIDPNLITELERLEGK